MSSGIGFMDILVSEVTIVIAAVFFLACILMLILKRKKLSSGGKAIFTVLLVLSMIYLAFIIWVVMMWGEAPHPEAALY